MEQIQTKAGNEKKVLNGKIHKHLILVEEFLKRNINNARPIYVNERHEQHKL